MTTKTKILNFINRHRMLLLMVLVALAVPSLTKAVEGVNIINDEASAQRYVYNSDLDRNHVATYKYDEQRNLYYCTNRSKWAPESSGYTAYSAGSPTLAILPTKVLALGYPTQNVPGGFTEDEKQYYITQLAFWIASNESAGMEFQYMKPSTVYGDEAENARILQAAKDLLAKAESTNLDLTNSIELVGSDQIALNDGTLVAGPFRVTGKNIVSSSFNITASGANQMRIYNSNLQTISTISYNQPFYVSFPKTGNPQSGTISISLNGSKTYMTGLRYEPKDSAYQPTGRWGSYTVPQSLVIAANWNIPIKGQVEITKTDLVTSAPLSGATIEIYNANGTKLFSKVTDANGKIVISDLGVGKYSFKETVAPNGYYLTTSTGSFEIKIDGEIVKANITNQRIPETPVQILKVDAGTNKPLAGAKIEVFSGSNKVFTGITDAAGKVNVGSLKAGTYTYKEITPPAGYNLNEEVYTFTLLAGQTATVQTIKNVAIPVVPDTPVQIVKIDAQTNKPLAGATIEVFNQAGIKIFSGITTVDGKVQVGVLKAGNYTYKEAQAPVGYVLNDKVYNFTVKAGDQSTLLTLKNEVIPTGKIEISKLDLTTSAPIEGATIEIYDSKGQIIYTNVSDEKGLISTTLSAGKYTFKEITAPIGYDLSTEIGQFEIKTNGEVVKAVMTNKKSVVAAPAELPHTGPIEAAAAIIAIAAVTMSVAYWHKSSKLLAERRK